MHWLPIAYGFDIPIESVAQTTGQNPLLFFIPIFLLEALILWLMRWGAFRRALLGSFLMNAATTLLGAVLQLRYPRELLVAFVLSLLIEGFILMFLNWRHKRWSWLAALAANIASYILLAIEFAVSAPRY